MHEKYSTLDNKVSVIYLCCEIVVNRTTSVHYLARTHLYGYRIAVIIGSYRLYFTNLVNGHMITEYVVPLYPGDLLLCCVLEHAGLLTCSRIQYPISFW